MQDDYTASLANKSIDELNAELKHIDNELDILFTMQNSLDSADLTQGGGSKETQAKYKEFVRRQDIVSIELQKREMLELLG